MNQNKVRIQTVAVPTEAPKVDAGLVVRTIVYLIAIVNAVLVMLGKDVNINVREDMIYEGVTIFFTLGSFAAAYWKNNNVTKDARIKDAAADQVIAQRK